jgi:hypothetical protein
MSITCLSRRESEAVGAAFPDLLDISVTLTDERLNEDGASGNLGAEKSTVLKIQQLRSFVNNQVENLSMTAEPEPMAVEARRLRSRSVHFVPHFSNRG